MPDTAVMTDRERAAVQAYVRLLHTVRAAFDSSPDPGNGQGGPVFVPPSVLAEADSALSVAGLAGNEDSFFRLLREWGA